MNSQPNQQPAAKSKAGAASNVGGITLSQPMVMIFRIILMVSAITHIFYAWLGQGDEVECGSFTKPLTCYQPGAEWLPMAFMATTVLILIGFIMLSRVNK